MDIGRDANEFFKTMLISNPRAGIRVFSSRRAG
jgi:hypothetical protein